MAKWEVGDLCRVTQYDRTPCHALMVVTVVHYSLGPDGQAVHGAETVTRTDEDYQHDDPFQLILTGSDAFHLTHIDDLTDEELCALVEWRLTHG